jgi:hypothetical protein
VTGDAGAKVRVQRLLVGAQMYDGLR